MTTPTEPHYISAWIPDPLGPVERGAKYADPLHAALVAAGLGRVTGGRTMLDAGDVTSVEVDVEISDPDRGRSLVAATLGACGAPPGSSIEYERDGRRLSLPVGR